MLLMDNNKAYKDRFNELLESTEEFVPLQEAYFKEGKDMKELLSLLEEARSKWIGKKINEKEKISSSKEMKAFNRKMEKFFGFKTFATQIVVSDVVNAWTFPISNKYDVKLKDGRKYISVTTNGYKYTGGEFNCMVCITSKIFCDKNFNTRDIMGIILHEVGHNFSFGLNGGQTIFGMINRASNTFYYINTLISTWILDNETAHNIASNVYNDEDNIITRLADHLRDNDNMMINIASLIMKPAALLYNIGLLIIDVYTSSFRTLLWLINYLTGGLMNPISFISKLYGYKDEKIGDNFATMYGFGPEVAKFEDKIYRMSHSKKPSFFIDFFSMLFMPFIFTTSLSDPHPRQLTRCLDQIKLLQSELEKEDMDEEIKKQIRIDIKKTEIELNKMQKSMDKYDSKGVRYFNSAMTKIFGGDFRELFINNKKFRSKYDDVKELDK